ncbi:MAG: response regulator [Planctomycetes bacterium]|nr:response regulator [Planctomycetota bacterium]
MAYTILAIDDTKKILDIIKYFLEQEGYVVRTASDPVEGIKIAQTERIDLILLDIMMPGMDGYTVFDKLKKESKTREIPVIMLTAKAIIMHTPKDFFYGLYGFLSKPFSKQQLVKMATDILRMTKSKEETQFLQPLEGESEEEGPTR